MKIKFKSRDALEIAALFVILALATSVWYKTSSPVAKEASHQNVCAFFLDIIEPSILADPRFVEVKLDLYEALGGSILVSGRVASHQDKDALIHFLEERFPPRPIVFHLLVGKAVHSEDPDNSNTMLFVHTLKVDRVHPKREPVKLLEYQSDR